MKTLGIYIHIPFCVQKCKYCDFCSFPRSDAETVERYVSALCRDIKMKGECCGEYLVDTVYFGGGTPTLLKTEQFEKVMLSVRNSFSLTEDCEITTECNPATADREYFSAIRKIGINRLSIGLQSADETELRALGRIHGYGDFVNTYKDARSAGFDNISVDLMYGIPHQTLGSFRKTLSEIVSLSPEHISAYGLKIEEGTPFGRMADTLALPDEDTEYEMYTACTDHLSKFGYSKYEISNFARQGYESRHNLKYWNAEEYLGFGVSAHSYFGDERFANSRDINGYINGENIVCDKRLISSCEKVTEYVMLRMRLRDGVSHSEFRKRFGVDFSETYHDRLEKYILGGYVENKEGKTYFTDKGFFISNYILSDILDFE